MKKKIILFILSFIPLVALITFVSAGNEHNTSGYAWSENIGWISFNNTTGGGSNYGVNIDSSTGDLSGYAWSEHIGWISFNRSDTGNPPQAPFNTGSGPIAKYNSDTNEITGWFRVLANGDGWDEWIKFYNVTLDANGDWHGWAWSDLVVGWISFNSSEGGGSSYRVTSVNVVNSPPDVFGLDVIPCDYCSGNPNNIFLSWQFSDTDLDDTQEFYQIEVTKVSDGTIAIGSKIPNDTTLIPVQYVNNNLAGLGYGGNFIWYDSNEQGYTWRVKVWDSQGAESSWSSSDSFDTTRHQWPAIDFNWSPTNPSINEDVQFTDGSDCFDADGDCDSWSWYFINGDPNTVICFDADGDCDSWSWYFINGDPNTVIGNNPLIHKNPIIKFTSDEKKAVTLQVTDSDNYTCPEAIDVDVNIKLPGWKEILPW